MESEITESGKRFEEFVLRITQIYTGMQKLKWSEMDSLDLKGCHVMCLFELSRAPLGLTGAELARQCSVDRAAVSRIIADLRRRELVQIDAPEGRKSYRAPVTLTESGKQVAVELDRKIERLVQVISGNFTKAERDFFYRALEQIAFNLQAETGR